MVSAELPSRGRSVDGWVRRVRIHSPAALPQHRAGRPHLAARAAGAAAVQELPLVHDAGGGERHYTNRTHNYTNHSYNYINHTYTHSNLTGVENSFKISYIYLQIAFDLTAKYPPVEPKPFAQGKVSYAWKFILDNP